MHCSKWHLHSITSSARASSCAGTVRPSACAVIRLTTSSNLVGCSTGMSAGFVPRRILSTKSASASPSRGSIGLISIPNDGATPCIAPYWPPLPRAVGSRTTATLRIVGATSLSSSSPLALLPYSKCVKPVAFPPGCAGVIWRSGAGSLSRPYAPQAKHHQERSDYNRDKCALWGRW
jgi:hypothetical protein